MARIRLCAPWHRPVPCDTVDFSSLPGSRLESESNNLTAQGLFRTNTRGDESAGKSDCRHLSGDDPHRLSSCDPYIQDLGRLTASRVTAPISSEHWGLILVERLLRGGVRL